MPDIVSHTSGTCSVDTRYIVVAVQKTRTADIVKVRTGSLTKILNRATIKESGDKLKNAGRFVCLS